MPDKILLTEIDGTPPQITFGDFATDFNPTAANDLRHASATDTEVQLDLTDLANAAARQSTKFDLGANRAPQYNVRCAFEFAATPVAGERVELYVAWSQHATAANGNPGGVSGADGAYAGYSSNMAASIVQLHLIGVVTITAQATGTVQILDGGVFSPRERYGSLVVRNESDAAFHSDAVESHVVFDPILPEVQTA